MKRKNVNSTGSRLTLALFLIAPIAVFADAPGNHPGYLHALSDLREARWLIEHRPGDRAVNGHEQLAIHKIDDGISDLKHAALVDNKDLADHPPVDVPLDRTGVLRQVLNLLRRAREDVNHEEDNPTAHAYKDGAIRHIEEATSNVKAAIDDFAAGR